MIIKQNPNVADGIYKISDVFDGIKLVETSSSDMVKTTDNIIRKMGFSTYNDVLQKHLRLNDIEFAKLISQPEVQLQKNIELIDKIGIEDIRATFKKRIEQYKDVPEYKDVTEAFNNELEIYELLNRVKDKMQDFPKSWDIFCKKNNYINELHSDTPWFTLESTVINLKNAAKGAENDFPQEMKEFFINDLKRAQSKIPKEKSFDFDFDKMIKIIKESESPTIALNRLEKELKIKSSYECLFLI